jgi:hypothetical protein
VPITEGVNELVSRMGLLVETIRVLALFNGMILIVVLLAVRRRGSAPATGEGEPEHPLHNKGITVSVTDCVTGDVREQHVPPGDYLLLTADPCDLASASRREGGREHVLVITGRTVEVDEKGDRKCRWCGKAIFIAAGGAWAHRRVATGPGPDDYSPVEEPCEIDWKTLKNKRGTKRAEPIP